MLGGTVLVLVAGVTVWWTTGRALVPVESLRAEVARISHRRLDGRVRDPGGGNELQRLAATMNELLDRIELAHSRQREFVADASHELRSPLAAINAQLEVDLAHPAATDWARSAEAMFEETHRMQRLVDDLLLLAQADQGRVETRVAYVDLDDIVLGQAARCTDPTAKLSISAACPRDSCEATSTS